MPETLSMMEARAKLTGLPEEFQRNPETGAVTVTRRGKPVLAVMPWELYDSMVETLEILSDEKLMRALRKSLREVRKGKTLSTAEVRRRLGL
ncbi:MAG TPA: type II toxin-antitoxin system prevent-host-death family antitoxin [Thermoanaerobaculia bacterium]|nr:type II toxin-antitoxin system prevent-host-death family antitoxin [Thermoanaerobaculia bacterium]